MYLAFTSYLYGQRLLIISRHYFYLLESNENDEIVDWQYDLIM